MANYLASVGMEVHAELRTQTKMFCRCPVEFGGEPNTRVCPVCLGLPGALPVPNQQAIQLVLRTALALNCQIAMHSTFHRKNYFYPDLPKGYQISQYGDTNPIGFNGYLDLPSGKRVHIRRVHLEEDTGKLIHESDFSGMDFNRAGVPLMEIVTEFPPDISNSVEAKEYIALLRQTLIYLGVCDGKMEHGSLRCEPNISIRETGSDRFGTKTELKNLASFRAVQLGVQFEVARQATVLEGGGAVIQETRGWDESKEASYSMRAKEEENDYRYFPDPDLMPMQFEQNEVDRLRDALPELPVAKRNRYIQSLGLSDYDADVLTAEVERANYFEEVVAAGIEPKQACNWMNSDLAMLLNDADESFGASRIAASELAGLLSMIDSGEISGKIAKQVLRDMFATGESARQVVERKGLTQVSDESAIRLIIQNVIQDNPAAVENYRAGQQNVLGFFVGQVMKASQGRANPETVQRLLRELINS